MFNRIKPYQEDSSIYVLNLTPEEKKKSSWGNLTYVVGIALTQVLAGLVNQASSRTAWVVYPYLTIFLPLAYAFLGVLTYWGATCRLSSTQYQEGLLRVKRSLLAVFVLTIVGILLEILYLVLHWKTEILLAEGIYIMFHILQILLIVAYGRFYDRTFSHITVEK